MNTQNIPAIWIEWGKKGRHKGSKKRNAVIKCLKNGKVRGYFSDLLLSPNLNYRHGARQRMPLSTSSLHWSGWDIGSLAEASASFRNCASRIFFTGGFISSSGTLFVNAVNAVKFGGSVKQSKIGVDGIGGR